MTLSTNSIARACASHPWRTIGAWIVALIAAFACIGLLLPGSLTTDGNPTNNPESLRAKNLIGRSFAPDSRREVTDIVVVRSARYTVGDPPFKTFVAGLVRQGASAKGVAAFRSYYTTSDQSLVSRDRHATMITLVVPNEDDIDHVLPIVANGDRDPRFAVAITGQDTLNHDFNKLSQSDLKSGELQFGLPAALIVLLLVFGAVVAGLVPLLMAVLAIVVALGLTSLLAQVFGLSVFIVNMLTAMGLALGIDYSLFVVSRYREERRNGFAKLDAIGLAGATASRAVLFSGTAFIVAMFGMLIVPSSIMASLAAGAILVGVTSVIAALTVLPALLGLLGDRVDRGRIPFAGNRAVEEGNPEGRFWRGVVTRVQRRPVISLVASVALLVALAAPVVGLDIGARGVASLPDNLISKQGFEALERSFPGASTAPAQILVADRASDPQVAATLQRLRRTLASDPRFGLGTISHSVVGDAAVLTVPVRGDAASDAASAAVRDLRSHVIPSVFAKTDADVLVGGKTSESIDYVDTVSDPAPYVFLFVLGLTFVLLTVVFRSIVIAATAVLLNLLSVAAAYGLLVLVFVHGFAADLLGFQQADTIEAWVPLFLFSVLFGLSMDYQVFLLTRIREQYLERGDTREAVAHGVVSTARLITGAALIIVVVFIGFARGDLVMFQQMGFGIAIALLIDATIIRSILVPSAMTVLGERNWYLPRWLRRLPDVHVEGAAHGSTRSTGQALR